MRGKAPCAEVMGQRPLKLWDFTSLQTCRKPKSWYVHAHDAQRPLCNIGPRSPADLYFHQNDAFLASTNTFIHEWCQSILNCVDNLGAKRADRVQPYIHSVAQSPLA